MGAPSPLLQLTLTLLGSPQLLVLLGWFLCAPWTPYFLASNLSLPSSFLSAYCDCFLPFPAVFPLISIEPFTLIHALPPPSLPGSPVLHSDLRQTFSLMQFSTFLSLPNPDPSTHSSKCPISEDRKSSARK